MFFIQLYPIWCDSICLSIINTLHGDHIHTVDDIPLLYSPKVHIHQSYVFHLVDEHDLEEWKAEKLA
jgi:hypothetical protein